MPPIKNMIPTLKQRLEVALGVRVVQARPLRVGFGLAGFELRLADGRHLAVKAVEERSARKTSLELEAYMLRDLDRLSQLPVPHVHYADASLLVMDYIETDGGGITPSVERHAGALIAQLHAVKRER